jgi:hypothetical protein
MESVFRARSCACRQLVFGILDPHTCLVFGERLPLLCQSVRSIFTG